MPYLIYLLLIIYLLFSCYTFYHNNIHTHNSTNTHTLLLYWLLLQFLPSTILQYINIYLYILYKHFCTYNKHHEISTIKKNPHRSIHNKKRQQYQPIQVPNPAVLIVSMKTYTSILKTRSNFED